MEELFGFLNLDQQAPQVQMEVREILDRGKIPEVVRDLPNFDGNPKELNEWIRDVQDTLEIYGDLQNQPIFRLIVKTIRRKVRGEASETLTNNSVDSGNWEQIRDTLRLYYNDKRDLMTLSHELKFVCKGKETVEQYYGRVRELLTLISSAIQGEERYAGHEEAVITLYNEMALDTFIRGLGAPLSVFCKNFRPQNLAQAYAYCVDYENGMARDALAKPSTSNSSNNQPPRRANYPAPAPRSLPSFNSPRPNAYSPQGQGSYGPPRQNVSNAYAPQARGAYGTPRQDYRPFFRTQPEPMEVDSSRIYRVENARPGPNVSQAQRRPPTQSMQVNLPAAKRQAYTLATDEAAGVDLQVESSVPVEEVHHGNYDAVSEEEYSENPFLDEVLQWESAHWEKPPE